MRARSGEKRRRGHLRGMFIGKAKVARTVGRAQHIEFGVGVMPDVRSKILIDANWCVKTFNCRRADADLKARERVEQPHGMARASTAPRNTDGERSRRK
jgi:hypothetical protein